jgi:hypothetical protein
MIANAGAELANLSGTAGAEPEPGLIWMGSEAAG